MAMLTRHAWALQRLCKPFRRRVKLALFVEHPAQRVAPQRRAGLAEPAGREQSLAQCARLGEAAGDGERLGTQRVERAVVRRAAGHEVELVEQRALLRRAAAAGRDAAAPADGELGREARELLFRRRARLEPRRRLDGHARAARLVVELARLSRVAEHAVHVRCAQQGLAEPRL